MGSITWMVEDSLETFQSLSIPWETLVAFSLVNLAIILLVIFTRMTSRGASARQKREVAWLMGLGALVCWIPPVALVLWVVVATHAWNIQPEQQASGSNT